MTGMTQKNIFLCGISPFFVIFQKFSKLFKFIDSILKQICDTHMTQVCPGTRYLVCLFQDTTFFYVFFSSFFFLILFDNNI